MVLYSSNKAEVGAAFFNISEETMIHTILTNIGHPQPITPLQVENSCAYGIINRTIRQRWSKVI